MLLLLQVGNTLADRPSIALHSHYNSVRPTLFCRSSVLDVHFLAAGERSAEERCGGAGLRYDGGAIRRLK
jgi:hypothetical protein